MSSAFMIGRIAETSPRFKARMAAVFYLLTVTTAAFIEIFVRRGLNVAAALIAVLSLIAVTLLFYDTFSPMNRRLAWLAASFNLAGLVFEALRLLPRGVNIAIVFDGFFCILIGCLLCRSSFAFRILGPLIALGGLGWLSFLSPPLANYLSPYNLASGILGEAIVMLWLLAPGVDVPRQQELASAQGKPAPIAVSAAL